MVNLNNKMDLDGIRKRLNKNKMESAITATYLPEELF